MPTALASRPERPRLRSLGLWLCSALFVASSVWIALATARTAATAPSAGPTLIELRGATLEVELDPEPFDLSHATLIEWVQTSARAVESFYGRFPVARARVRLIPVRGKGVVTGRTEAWDGARIDVRVGIASDRGDLTRDWIMVHEMVHLAFPSVPRAHHWIEEGLATYVEPLARLEIGEVTPERVWLDLVNGLPNGLPQTGDRGLDLTPTWGRTYWGGALFCLLAELKIRRRTNDAKGLRDALRGILAAGGRMTKRWPLEKALAEGDRALGIEVLMPLYMQMRASPYPVDLERLWHDLGIERTAEGLRFHDDAPLAATRRAITRVEPAAAPRSGSEPRQEPASNK